MITTADEGSDSTPLLELRNVSIIRFNSPEFVKKGFRNINWRINKGETWVITGPVGAGKTTLAEALCGKYPIQSGSIQYFNSSSSFHPPEGANKRIVLVSFQPNSRLLNYNNYYYQQRYNSTEADSGLTVRKFLIADQKENEFSDILNIIPNSLGIADLLNLEVIKLSNGQTRKMLLAKALLQKPILLLLDNPYSGLDTESRHKLNLLLQDLINHNTNIILITNLNELPEFATHVMEVANFNIKGQFTRAEYLAKQKQENPTSSPNSFFNFLDLYQPVAKAKDFDICVQFENTSIQYGDKVVLNNINWTVRKGEKWALTGPNGSGKTTLLSLINGDNPQAFANKITLFDKRKGTGESIWDLKKRIGFVSPELHLYFRRNITAEAVVATGFGNTLYLNRPLTSEEGELVNYFFSYFQLEPIRHTSFLQLSTGQHRLIFIVRSLLKNPDLLIWDEPFQSLSAALIDQSLNLLKAYATQNKTIILVSHYSSEIPVFKLDDF